MTGISWRQHLNLNTDPNWQVKTFTDTFLNIMSNFIPNETKIYISRNPPWITKLLKTMLNRKNRLFNNYKRHGYKAQDKVRLDAFRIECQQAVETAKPSYLTNLGNKVNNPATSQTEKKHDTLMTTFHSSASLLSIIVRYSFLVFSPIRE